MNSSIAIVLAEIVAERKVFETPEDPEHYSVIFTVRTDQVLLGNPLKTLKLREELDSGRYPIGISIAATHPPGLVGLVLSTTFLNCPRPYLGQLRLLLKLLPPIRIPSAPFVPLLLNGRSTPDARELLRIVLHQASPRAMLTRLNDVAMVDVTTEARSIRVPTLYLRASADRVVPGSAGDAVKQHIRRATIAELAGPHLLLQACPYDAAKRIVAFCAGVCAS